MFCQTDLRHTIPGLILAILCDVIGTALAVGIIVVLVATLYLAEPGVLAILGFIVMLIALLVWHHHILEDRRRG